MSIFKKSNPAPDQQIALANQALQAQATAAQANAYAGATIPVSGINQMQQAVWAGPSHSISSAGISLGASDITIREIDNGFIVTAIGIAPSYTSRTYIATDVEDLQRVIALALVNRKMDGVK